MSDGGDPEAGDLDGPVGRAARVSISIVKRGGDSIASITLHDTIVPLDRHQATAIEVPYEEIDDGFARSVVVEVRFHD
jgi:hypothetical protein